MIFKLKYILSLLIVVLFSGCVSNISLIRITGDLEDRYIEFNRDENLLGWELIHFAAAVGTREEIVEIIDNTTDLNIKDINNNTPITVAQRYNNLETFEELLKAGALLKWKNYFNKESIPKAIEIAGRYGYDVNTIDSRHKYLTSDVLHVLMPPDMNYKYFENAKAYPFQPTNTNFSYINCWWLAECAFLAYTPPEFAKIQYEKAGFNNYKFFKQSMTECMVVWNKKSIIISFRGTSEFNDVLADIRTIQTNFPLGGKVHKGFFEAYKSIKSGDDGLKTFIEELTKDQEKRAIWITGHSFGGALAGLFFTDFENATGLYTFGAPRIGDKEFLQLTSGRPMWRVENNQDIVITLPKSFGSLNYGNLGYLIFFGEFGELYDLTDSIYTKTYTNYRQSYLPFQIRGVRNHMPINYVVKSWNNLINH